MDPQRPQNLCPVKDASLVPDGDRARASALPPLAASSRAERVSETLRAVVSVQRLALTETDAQRLLGGLCSRLLRLGGVQKVCAAWLDPEGKGLCHAKAGSELVGQSLALQLVHGEIPPCLQTPQACQQPVSYCVPSSYCQSCQVWREAQSSGLECYRLSHRSELWGTFSVWLWAEQSLAPEEQELLSEMSAGLSMALQRLRTLQSQEPKGPPVDYPRLFAQCPAGLLAIDSRGTVLGCNGRVEELLSMPGAMLVGTNLFTSLTHPQLLEALRDALKGQRTRFEGTYESRFTGRTLALRISVQGLIDDKGQCDGALAVMQELSEGAKTETHRGAESLRQTQQMEALGRLAGGVAHDFNNLLSPILGYTELALMSLGSGDALRHDLEAVQSAALQAKNLTEQLLAFGRKQSLQMLPLDLNAVLRETEKILRRLMPEDIAIHYRLEPTLKSIQGDRSQIEHILINLALNARDAMPQGGAMTIQTRNAQLDNAKAEQLPGLSPGPCVLLTVSDTGQGMDQDTQGHVFEPFFTTKAKGQGTGLGLATVYSIVKQHGGCIDAQSELGKGSSFNVYLSPIEGSAPPDSFSPAVQSPRLGGETILVVEDEKGVRKLARRVLEQQGYRVLEAEDGSEALKLAECHVGPIHLLLSDIVMPKMNGSQLYQQLVTTRPELKVVFMSGYAESIIAHHGILDEGVRLLQKPFSVIALTRMVRDALDGL